MSHIRNPFVSGIFKAVETLVEQIKDLNKRWQELLPSLGLDSKRKEARELEAKSLHEDFWSKPEEARRVLEDLAEMQNEIKVAEEIDYRLQTVRELADLAQREHQDLTGDLKPEVEALHDDLGKLEGNIFLSGPYDKGGAIVSVHSGQGGTEAMDWAQMLMRMYLRFFERQGWKTDLIDESKGEEAGIKSATLEVRGQNSYGQLKHEAGTHRLVRQSPFNADKLRQTSFALVEVLPIIPETHAVSFKPDEVKLESFLSSGAGGQNVNKVNSAVRLTHLPSGISVSVQTERSQLQNREYAMKILRARVWELEEAKRRGEIKSLKGEYRPASWGNQIRSYVLHPYHLVKDLRTGFETADTEAVLNGELEGFIEAELRS